MQITFIGPGNMAGGIATRALTGGHRVRLVGNDATKTEALVAVLRERVPGADVEAADGVDGADIVVLTLPYPAGRDVVAARGDELAGKVVVDISNPVDFATFDSLVTSPGTSAAEEIAAAAADGVTVVKAFNTTFAGLLVAGEVDGTPLDVFIAGDDEMAKKKVSDLVTSGGLRPLDAGPLRRARELEALQFLHMAMQQTLGTNWGSAIKILP
ncbi:NADPH-dependent F420 reductase [Streptomyces sp. NBC_00203]|uniref:NADPH-dependent F420 reductase n=1 Tax=Streptomyces sp. NBC_00203 TaxID=2975680 RepID=UPI0032446FDB